MGHLAPPPTISLVDYSPLNFCKINKADFHYRSGETSAQLVAVQLQSQTVQKDLEERLQTLRLDHKTELDVLRDHSKKTSDLELETGTLTPLCR